MGQRKAVVWECDQDGMSFHYYVEVKQDYWRRVGQQSEQESKVEKVVHFSPCEYTPTYELTYCADGGVIIDGDTFTGIEV